MTPGVIRAVGLVGTEETFRPHLRPRPATHELIFTYVFTFWGWIMILFAFRPHRDSLKEVIGMYALKGEKRALISAFPRLHERVYSVGGT